MILTVTPNASLDKTYVIEGFGIDRMHRPTTTYTIPGGKGINVARVLRELGRDAIASGFVGGRVGDAILEGLVEENIKNDFVRVKGESRICIKVMDPKSGTQTEINEAGPQVSSGELEMLLEKISDLMPEMEYVVLCGNVPPGAPASFYSDVVRMVKQAGIKVVLDTSEENLREAIKSGPYMVKPNIAELSQLAGHELLTLEEICGAAKSLKQYGVEITAVTMGRSGAMVTDGVHSWKAVPPEIEFASAVGSGDTFLAAFLNSLLLGGYLPDALVAGTAAGAANATTYNAGFCSKECIMDIQKGVALTEID